MNLFTDLDKIFHPSSIAIAGASNNALSMGHGYTRFLLDNDYRGKIYPINRDQPEIIGLKAYPNLTSVPGPIDYVICCLPSGTVPELIRECAKKYVKVLHLFTARFGETGRSNGRLLEKQILNLAQQYGIRLIGPNCMGIYYPKEGLSFVYDLPREPGKVGMVSQTGGGASIFIQQASLRGVRFSKVISYGNGIDLDESDFLNYLAHDTETDIITMYVEGVRDGRKFFNELSNATKAKPVIIIKGGRSISGSRGTISHTASLAGTTQIWQDAVAQCGAVWARDIEEMVDITTTFYHLPSIKGKRAGVMAGSGGESILAADLCEEAGLEVPPLPKNLRKELITRAPDLWDWLGNPVDQSIFTGPEFGADDMMEIMAGNEVYDVLIANITEGGPRTPKDSAERHNRHVDGFIKTRRKYGKPVLVILRERSVNQENKSDWRWEMILSLRSKLVNAGIPIYPTTYRAANAFCKAADYYVRRARL